MDTEELEDLAKSYGKAVYGFCHKLAGTLLRLVKTGKPLPANAELKTAAGQ